jgi:penicillin amidase
MQMDTLDLFARDTKDIAARAADAAGRADLAGALRTWDGTMGADRTEPSLFYAWYRALQRVTFDDELGGFWRPGAPVHVGLRSGGSAWFDDITTPAPEDLAAMALRAMREAIPVAAGTRWGDMHRTVSRHALGTVRSLDLLLRLNLGPAPRAGSLYTVNVADFSEAAPPFMNSHAASFRQVVDLAAPEDGMLILTSGQSGNPLSAHYRDQRPRWWRGELWRVPLSASLVRPVAELRLTAR